MNVTPKVREAYRVEILWTRGVSMPIRSTSRAESQIISTTPSDLSVASNSVEDLDVGELANMNTLSQQIGPLAQMAQPTSRIFLISRSGKLNTTVPKSPAGKATRSYRNGDPRLAEECVVMRFL